jgi:short-subunit dehydrogenase
MAAERGARVVMAARSGDALARIQAEIEGVGGKAIHVVADVGRRADVQAVADRAIATFGGFDTWVNVAGLSIYGRLREISDADHERLIQTNFWGTVFGSLVAAEHLRDHGGALINVGSIASDLAFPYQGMYAASKHAVKGFTDALRMELMHEGAPVSVTLIKPASIDTPLPNRARNYMDREPSLPPPIYPPEEVANAILHAAVHPQRDIFVGGAGKAFTAGKEFAPGAYDYLTPAIIALQKRASPPPKSGRCPACSRSGRRDARRPACPRHADQRLHPGDPAPARRGSRPRWPGRRHGAGRGPQRARPPAAPVVDHCRSRPAQPGPADAG